MLILSPLAPCSATGQIEQTVTVDGLGMRVVSAGLATRAPEQPVVIFESGAGSPLETWNPIFPAVAEFAPKLVDSSSFPPVSSTSPQHTVLICRVQSTG